MLPVPEVKIPYLTAPLTPSVQLEAVYMQTTLGSAAGHVRLYIHCIGSQCSEHHCVLFIRKQCAPTETCTWWTGCLKTRGGWKYATATSGEQSVMTSGTHMLQEWPADS